MFCTDKDLLRWEPRLAIDAAFAARTLIEGRGRLAGRTLIVGRDAVACGGAIVAIGDDCFTLAAVDGASVLIGPPPLGVRAQWPDDGDVDFAVRTFAAQRSIVTSILARLAGVEGDVTTLANAAQFRRPCALGALHLIYASLAAAALGEDADWSVRADLYERLYRKALRAICVDLEEGEERARRLPLSIPVVGGGGGATARYPAIDVEEPTFV